MPPSKFDWKGSKIFSVCCGFDAGAGIGEAHLPIRTALGERYGQTSTLFLYLHRTDCVFAEIPEHLFKLVAISQHPGLGLGEIAVEDDAGVLGSETMFEQSQCVLQQGDEIHALKAVLLAARVCQKIG